MASDPDLSPNILLPPLTHFEEANVLSNSNAGGERVALIPAHEDPAHRQYPGARDLTPPD
jgi:hypothetical protein